MHFIKADFETRMLGKPWVMVMVELRAKTKLVVLGVVERGGEAVPNISVAKADVLWAPLPAGITVENEDGEIITPSAGRQYFVTAETVNPYHGLAEMDPKDFRP